MFRAWLVLAFFPALVTAQPLIITAPAAPGGGWDQTARVMQRVLTQIEPGISVQVENVPGAAGTIGLSRFIQSERGNPHALMVTGLVMLSGVILNGSPVSLAHTTPIARLTGEYEVIVVPAASPFRTMTDLIEAFKKDPGSVSWGGGSAGGTDDLLIRLLAEQVGLPASSVNYIAFSGGGAALAAVLGGQLSAAVSGYAEFAGQITAGQLRVLAISSASRVNGIDAPTLREAGIALDLANWRAVVAPPGISDAERDALTMRITAMASSPQWRAALAQNGWDDQFLTGPQLRQFLLSEQSRIEDVLRRLSSTSTTASSTTFAAATLPNAVAALFLAVLVITALTTTRELQAFEQNGPVQSRAGPNRTAYRRGQPATVRARRAGSRMALAIAAALLILPPIFVTAGFIVASTLMFGIVATAMRASIATRSIVVDLAIGTLVSSTLFLVFTRGLGVSLPGFF